MSKHSIYLGREDDEEAYEKKIEEDLKSLGYWDDDEFTPRGTLIVKHWATQCLKPGVPKQNMDFTVSSIW